MERVRSEGIYDSSIDLNLKYITKTPLTFIKLPHIIKNYESLFYVTFLKLSEQIYTLNYKTNLTRRENVIYMNFTRKNRSRSRGIQT